MFNRLLLTTTLVLAVWISATTAQNETCTNGGIAQSRLHPICTCRSGFKGYDCSQRVGACEGRPCRNGGTCSENRDGTFTCICDDEHKGILCEQRITPCDSGPCKNGGNCTDDGEKCFKCECPPGFKGSDCSEIVQPCEIKPCKNNGICMNEEGGRFTCKCKQRYAGIFCEKRVPQRIECFEYKWLNESSRNRNYSGSTVSCDRSLLSGWYRFGSGAGIKIAATCVPSSRCGTHATGWMNGAHPTVADGKVIRKVCYHWTGNCCRWSNNIEVVNCGQYYVYKLSPSPGCSYRYCGSDY